MSDTPASRRPRSGPSRANTRSALHAARCPSPPQHTVDSPARRCSASIAMFERELRQIDEQAGQILELVRKLAEINSGSDNLAGLARVEVELIELLKQLTPDVRSVELPPGTRMD